MWITKWRASLSLQPVCAALTVILHMHIINASIFKDPQDVHARESEICPPEEKYERRASYQGLKGQVEHLQ